MDGPNLKCLFRNYRKEALRRDLKWELTLEEFAELTKQSCYLCGIEPTGRYVHWYAKKKFADHPYIYSGIDRFDNSKGYVSGNVISACKTCNMLKKTMDIEMFLEHIRRVYFFNFGVDGDGR